MYKLFFKRVLDVIISSIALLCIGWFILLIAIFLHWANKGAGAFFLQERPGKDEKKFKIIKFKTMTDERDAEGNLLPDKERITKVGAVVRKWSIDELPQLINVFKGDMAFIGPRPLLPEYLPWYTEREHLRHTVRPGMSGWAQVNGRNTLSWDEKLALDVYYVENLSFLMDCKVIATTVVNVLQHKDVNVVPGLRLGKLDDIRKQQK
ncbi:MAG: sugar transferase [Bacteroidales bacterium]|nr:sugar transferase [Bacteroidales bacterium]